MVQAHCGKERHQKWRWSHKSHWLVVSTPLKNMSSSLGMMTFPICGKILNVPNHQPVTIIKATVLSCPRHPRRWFHGVLYQKGLQNSKRRGKEAKMKGIDFLLEENHSITTPPFIAQNTVCSENVGITLLQCNSKNQSLDWSSANQHLLHHSSLFSANPQVCSYTLKTWYNLVYEYVLLYP